MADYTNSGVLFKNKDKSSDKAPDYTGKINVNGTEMRLAAWIKDGKSGKFMSLKVSEEEGQRGRTPPPADDFNDDSLPF